LLAVLLLLVLPASAAANTEIIVKRDAGLSAAERADIRTDADVRLVERLPLPRTEVVAAAPGDVQDALRDLNADPDVVYAEPNRPVEALTNDTYYEYLWGLENLGNFSFGDPPDPAVFDADMDVPEAWTSSTGGGRTVAVVDSGVEAGHPDLGGRVVTGWDYVEDDPYANDEHGHGTHVAGTIAATRGNAAAIAGVAPDARILPVRVLGEDGQGFVADVIKAYKYAADQGVAVVNASLGGEGFIQAEYDAIASRPNTLFVVAAGNDGQDNDVAAQNPEYPCSYNLPNILCVGASKHDDERADFSNYGDTTVDVFAPGYGIYSTVPGGGYDWNNGTSMATPHVAGLAALLLARNPQLSPIDVKDATILTAEDKPAFTGFAFSDGRANADDALHGIDDDVDGVSDGEDNCPSVPNPGQEDVVDPGGAGDACPPAADADGDTVILANDACPDEPASYAANGCPSADPTGDGDFWPDAVDDCDAQAGTIKGCPDSDGDGLADWNDNCAGDYNPGQENVDGDVQGDVCDGDRDNDGLPNGSDVCPDKAAATSNGCVQPPVDNNVPPADRDGDGVYDVADACPTVPAATANGCPLPQVTSVSAKGTKRGRKRSATVTVSTSTQATVKITVERKRGRKWVRVARKTVVTSGSRARVKVSGLKRGSHRVRISVSSSAGSGTPVTKGFRVR
jgi:thermitase